MTIDSGEVRAAVDKAAAAAARMMGDADEYLGRRSDGYVDDAHAAAAKAAVGRQDRRRTAVLPDTAGGPCGTARALFPMVDTLDDAQRIADDAHARSQVKATFAVVAAGNGFAVVPAWSANVDSVLYRTGA